ncbi:MAG TPA: alpha/beta hydrolase [Acidimicrobiia bacterium]|nr:alpha/beta hydrolase [Acidimicrobiia bacterium]
MSRYVPTPQGLVHEVEFGGSGPAIVLIHGLGGSTTNWNAVGPSLGDLGVVKAIDLPGFGLTPPRADYRLDTHRDSVIGYLETLEGRATLIGNSTGGLLAELVAADRPDLVDRLILVSPATPPILPDPRMDWPTAIRLAIQATPGLGEAYGRRFIRRNTPEELVRKSMAMITHKPGRVPMSLIEESQEMARIRKGLPWAEHATARTATSIARLYSRRPDYVRMILSIEAPTLVVQGTSDHIVSPTSVEWLCTLRPDWDLAQLEDTGHTPQMDAPGRFLAVVRHWLAPAQERAVGS